MCVILNYVQHLCSEETITIIGDTLAACTSRMQPTLPRPAPLPFSPNSTPPLILIIPLLNKIAVETNLNVNSLNCKKCLVLLLLSTAVQQLIQLKKQTFKGYS